MSLVLECQAHSFKLFDHLSRYFMPMNQTQDTQIQDTQIQDTHSQDIQSTDLHSPECGATHGQVQLTGCSQDIALWIWENLVPSSGRADTLQGEVIRAIELLAWEAQNNGNLNWDKEFDRLVDFLREVFTSSGSVIAATMNEEDKLSAAEDLHRLSNFLLPTELDSRVYIEELPYVKEDLYDRLTDHLIGYCRQSPEVIYL